MHGLLLWLHVASSALYLGATIAVAAVFLPTIRGLDDASLRRRLFARGMRVYNPLAIGAIGVALMSGAFNLTDYKASLGKAFAPALGGILAWKLVAVFALILVATGLSFGIAHRTVREELAALPVDAAELDRRLRRLPGMLWTAAALTLAAMWLGVEMVH